MLIIRKEKKIFVIYYYFIGDMQMIIINNDIYKMIYGDYWVECIVKKFILGIFKKLGKFEMEIQNR